MSKFNQRVRPVSREIIKEYKTPWTVDQVARRVVANSSGLAHLIKEATWSAPQWGMPELILEHVKQVVRKELQRSKRITFTDGTKQDVRLYESFNFSGGRAHKWQMMARVTLTQLQMKMDWRLGHIAANQVVIGAEAAIIKEMLAKGLETVGQAVPELLEVH
jgi:AraC-like DNA-binding protein